MAKYSLTPELKRRLKQLGMSEYGLKKFATKYLSQVIHEGEAINGVVYGRYFSGSGALSLEEGMLVATDRRVIFLDHKPGFTDLEEITYDMIGGVRHQKFGPFNTVTLHSRLGDFPIRYTNAKCSQIFTEYIENRRISQDENKPLGVMNAAAAIANTNVAKLDWPIKFLDDAGTLFLKEHDVGVLSTVDQMGDADASVVYYIVDKYNNVYILTKQDTHKAKNILLHKNVVLSVFDATNDETLSLHGKANIEQDEKIKEFVFSQIVKPRYYKGVKKLPPITSLDKGAYVIIRITPKSGHYVNYKMMG